MSKVPLYLSLQENDKHIKFLMQHIHAQDEATPTTATPTAAGRTEELVAKVKALERDLYYYRKTSRDLKKKLQTASSVVTERTAEGGNGTALLAARVGVAEEGVNSAPEMEGGKTRRTRAKLKRRRDVTEMGRKDAGGSGGSLPGRSEVGAESGGSLPGRSEVGAECGGSLVGKGYKGPERINAATSIAAHGSGEPSQRLSSAEPPGPPTVSPDGLITRGPRVTGAAGHDRDQQGPPLPPPPLPRQHPVVVVKKSRKELRQLK